MPDTFDCDSYTKEQCQTLLGLQAVSETPCSSCTNATLGGGARHAVLVVGDGDLSFAAAVASPRLTATVLEDAFLFPPKRSEAIVGGSYYRAPATVTLPYRDLGAPKCQDFCFSRVRKRSATLNVFSPAICTACTCHADCCDEVFEDVEALAERYPTAPRSI